jgi:hypothetical protein
MIRQKFHINIGSHAQNLEEANKEIGQLKCVIGFVMAQLPEEQRAAVIRNLESFGLTESAEEFRQFVK